MKAVGGAQAAVQVMTLAAVCVSESSACVPAIHRGVRQPDTQS